jgi:phage regulator Rha-like protein
VSDPYDISKWFRPKMHASSDGDVEQSYDMTRNGMMLLVMGWDDEKSASLQLAYVSAFNAMADELLTLKHAFTGQVIALKRTSSLLRSGHCDPEATDFRAAYMMAFDAMEAKLRELRGDSYVDELFAPLARAAGPFAAFWIKSA